MSATDQDFNNNQSSMINRSATTQSAGSTRVGADLDVASVVAVLGLAVTLWIHLKDLSDKFAETPYLGVGYAVLVVAAVAAAVMIATGRQRGWLLAGGACAATIVGFVLTRTTGLPAATGDIGNWSEPAGIYALIAEGAVIAATAYVLIGSRQRS